MWSADKHAMAHGWEKEEELKLILASGALFNKKDLAQNCCLNI